MNHQSQCHSAQYIDLGQKPMFAAEVDSGPTEANSAEDFPVLAEKAAIPALENDAVAEPLPIPWHLLFPPGHPMRSAGHT